MIRGRHSDLAELRHLLDRRRDLEADITTRVVIGRESDGAEIVQPITAECTERGEGAHASGQTTLTPSTWSPSHLGRTGASATVDAGIFHLDSHEPPLLPRGATHQVTLRGSGLRAGMAFLYLLAAEQIHHGVSIDAADFVDSTTYELTVTVAPDAELVAAAPVGYQLGEALPGTVLEKQAPRLYGITYAVATSARYQALWKAGSSLRVGYYSETGDLLGEPTTVPASGWSRERTAPIFTDQAAQLSDHSLLWTDGDLHVVDSETGATYEYSAPAGAEVAGATYQAGKIWWLEWVPGTSHTCPITVRRAQANLTQVEIVGTYQLPNFLGGPAVEWRQVWAVGFTNSRAAIVIQYTGAFSFGVLELLDATGYAIGLIGDSDLGVPDAHGGSIAGGKRWDGERVDEGGEGGGEGFAGTSPGWVEWTPTGWQADAARGGVDSTGTLAVLYDGTDVIEGRILSPEPEPDRRVTLAPHPTLGAPDLVFPTF